MWVYYAGKPIEKAVYYLWQFTFSHRKSCMPSRRMMFINAVDSTIAILALSEHVMNEFDHRILALLKSSEKGLKNSGPNGDSSPDLCHAGAVLNWLGYQANWEQVVMWVDYEPVNVEIGDDNTRSCI